MYYVNICVVCFSAVSTDLLLTATPQEVPRETKKEVANEAIATEQTKKAESMAYKVETVVCFFCIVFLFVVQ